MENNVMKNMMKWSLRILAAILTISSLTVLTSCSKDEPVIPQPEPQTVVLKGEAAVAWTKDYLDSLVNVYMAECENLLDPDMKFYCLDNNHNNGGKLVTHEEAKLWDYSMTEDLQQKLYAIKQSYIDSGKLTTEQMMALQ